MQAASRSATRSRCSDFAQRQNAAIRRQQAASVEFDHDRLAEADDRPGSGSIELFMADAAPIEIAYESASTTRLYAKSTV